MRRLLGVLFTAALLLGNGQHPDDPVDLAAQAYVYAYPLVLMDITKDVMTAVPAPEAMRAPVNQFAHARQFPSPQDTDVVSPNADTLYSSAWLDLGAEPIVLSIPASGNRYRLFEILDAWTNVTAAPGTRTTGNGAGLFAIVGPHFHGALPAGVTEIRSPTDTAWIIGRILCDGSADFGNVHALQDRLSLTPLSSFGYDYEPPLSTPVDEAVDLATPPAEQIDRLDAARFYARFAAALRANPPAAGDGAFVSRLAALGIVPGLAFSFDALTDAQRTALERGLLEGRARVAAAAEHLDGAVQTRGWDLLYDLGAYGTNYAKRAGVAKVGLGANLTADAFYPFARHDANGAILDGAHRYVLHFAADQLPPARAFWSLTMYDDRHFFVPNELERYALGDRSNLRYNADGSLDLYLQRTRPVAPLDRNWLPAPAGVFNLVLRLYWPRESVLDRSWTPPAVTRAPDEDAVLAF